MLVGAPGAVSAGGTGGASSVVAVPSIEKPLVPTLLVALTRAS